MNCELSEYIEECYNFEKDRKFDNVFVTDHEKVDPKYTTEGEEEDNEFYEY